MDTQSENKSLRENIVSAIKNGRVKMRPRWYFVLKAVLAVLGAATLVLAILYLVSFIIFILHQTGIWFVPIFGFRGIRVFLFSLPWALLALAFVFAAVLEVLVRRYSFAYRRPLLYSIAGIILLVIFGGSIVSMTSFHRGLFMRAEENRLPLGGHLYRQFAMKNFRNVHRGVITKVTDDGFIVSNRRLEVLNIIVTPDTRLPMGFGFAEGDAVVVFGEREEDFVKALGIRKVDEEFRSNPRGPAMMRQFKYRRP